MEDLIGKTVDNYQITSELGKGGMGIVYLAYDVQLDRKVAIKMLNSRTIGKENFIQRFKREAKNQAKLTHPNIVTVYGFIEYFDLLGIVMEYVEGESLEKVIYRQKRLHLFDAVYILKQVLAGIGYAHSKGFIHRDMKPSNIIFNKEGVAKIMDFGISKSLFEKGVTQTGAKVGTVLYMSPEQIKGTAITPVSDIYSIGCTFYEMVTGLPPFYSESEYDVMDGHLKSVPAKMSERIPGIPTIVDKVISKSLNKAPNERYADCNEFLVALREIDKYIAGQQLGAQTPPPRRKKTEKEKKEQKSGSIVAFLGFIVIFLGLAYFIYSQVDRLFKSGVPETLKKHSIQTLFSGDSDYFSDIEEQTTNTLFALNSIDFYNATRGVAAGDSGVVLATNNAGETWNTINLNTKATFNDVFIKSGGKAFIVGDSSRIYTSDTYNSWQRIPMRENFTFLKIHFKDELNGYILGANGILFSTNNGGESWIQIGVNTSNALYGIDFIDSQRGFIVGWNGLVLATEDGGSTWIQKESFTRRYLKSVDFVGEVGLAVGGGGVIYRSIDAGDSWEAMSSGQVNALEQVKFLDENKAIILGRRGIILYTEDRGNNWEVIDTQVYVHFKDTDVYENVVYISGVNGTILRLL